MKSLPEKLKKLKQHYHPFVFALTFFITFVILFSASCYHVWTNSTLISDATYESVELMGAANNGIITTVSNQQIILDFNGCNSPIYGFSCQLKEPSNVRVYFSTNDTFMDSLSTQLSEVSDINFTPYANDCYYMLTSDSAMELTELKYISELSYHHHVMVWKIIVAFFINLVIAMMITLLNPWGILFDEMTNQRTLKRFFISLSIATIANGIIVKLFAYAIRHFVADLWNRNYSVLLLVVLEIITIVILLRKELLSNLHVAFFLVCMLVCCAHIYLAPTTLGVCWDDETHYLYTTSVVHGGKATIGVDDSWLISRQPTNIAEQMGYSAQDRSADIGQMNHLKRYSQLTLPNVGTYFSIRQLCYFPAALGITLGKMIGLNFKYWFMLGKFMNALLYSFLISWAIKQLQTRGKILCAAIALMPAFVMLASQYSYDGWVLSFVILGYAQFIALLQSKKTITVPAYLGTIGCVCIGILPKAIYVVLLIPMLLISSKHLKKPVISKVCVILGGAILAATFVLPVLISIQSGVAMGDMRGGSDVSAGAQLLYIAGHPFSYVTVLFGFLAQYIFPVNYAYYLTNLSYLGYVKGAIILFIWIVIAALIDSNEKKQQLTIAMRLYIMGSCLLSAIMIATTFYLAYTPVGYNDILGCQGRYLFPILFPALYAIFENHIKINNTIKKIGCAITLLLPSLLMLYGIYSLILTRY